MLKVQKSLGITALLSLLSTAAFAVPFDGFYVGGAVGGSQSSVAINQSVDVNATLGGNNVLNLIQKNNHHETDDSFVGDLNLGFGHVFQQSLYVGLEGDVAFQSLGVSSTSSIQNTNPNSPLTLTAQTKAKISDQFSLAFLPGIVLQQNTLLYGKVGPAWGNVDTKGSANYNHIIFSPLTLSGSNHFNDSGYQTGLLLGVGLEHYVAQNVSIKLEYDHVNYGTIHGSSTNTSNVVGNDPVNFPVSGEVADHDRVSANTNSVMFGVAFHIT